MFHRWTIGLVLLLAAIPSLPAQAPVAGSTTAAPVNTYTVPAGTRILLTLKNEISTRLAAPGDPVYLVSDFPVLEDGAVVLPAGLYVKGVVDSVKRAGKVKGRAQLQMHFVSILFPNGLEVPLPGSLDKVTGSGGAKVKNSEGTVEQAGSNGKDAQRVASNTLEGAGVGGLVGSTTGSVAMGSGIGAGAGAAVGVLTTLLARNNDVVIPQGTSLEMTLSRPIVLQYAQLAGMPASTGMVVQATATAQQPSVAKQKPNH
jgi:type IV secretion system protein VirB10